MAYPIQSPDIGQGLKDFTDTRTQLTLYLGETVMPVVVVGTTARSSDREATAGVNQAPVAAQSTIALLEAPALGSGIGVIVQAVTFATDAVAEIFWGIRRTAVFAGTNVASGYYKGDGSNPTATIVRGNNQALGVAAADLTRAIRVNGSEPHYDDFGGKPFTIPPGGQFFVATITVNVRLYAAFDFTETQVT